MATIGRLDIQGGQGPHHRRHGCSVLRGKNSRRRHTIASARNGDERTNAALYHAMHCEEIPGPEQARQRPQTGVLNHDKPSTVGQDPIERGFQRARQTFQESNRPKRRRGVPEAQRRTCVSYQDPYWAQGLSERQDRQGTETRSLSAPTSSIGQNSQIYDLWGHGRRSREQKRDVIDLWWTLRGLRGLKRVRTRLSRTRTRSPSPLARHREFIECEGSRQDEHSTASLRAPCSVLRTSCGNVH